MNNAGQASIASSKETGFFGGGAKILGSILRFFGIILLVAIIIVGIFVAFRYFSVKQETGQLASVVKHGEVATTETLSPAASMVKKFSPDLCAALFPSECPYNPFAIESAVDANVNNKDLGVKILEFKPVADFFRPNQDINLLGKIKARGLDKPITLQVFCSLEDYNDEELFPAQLSGLTASGNEGKVFKDQTAEFIAQCNFPGQKVEKQVTSKKAKLVVVYDFLTKAYQRIWFMDKEALLNLQSQGIDPFELYAAKDNLLDSDRKIKSVTTPGPLNLGLQIDFPQPLSQDTKYLLLVQLSRTLEAGNLQKINYLKIKVPSVQDLDISVQGEKTLVGSSQCDFEFTGQAEEQGYKEYQLSNIKIEETNQECDKKSLKELALSESDCLKFYKEPLFLCNFAATKVPSTLSSDTIRSEVSYTFKVEKQTVADIKALPSELVS